MRRSRPGDSHRNGTRAKGEGWGARKCCQRLYSLEQVEPLDGCGGPVGPKGGFTLQILPFATRVEIPTVFVPTAKNAPHQDLE